MAKYPYDKKTGKIELPAELEDEIKQQAERGDIVTAMNRVMDLTGAGLRYSKDYIDQFRR